MAKATKTAKKGTRRRERKNVPHAVAHIQATFNNTIVTFTDATGGTHLLELGRPHRLQGLAQGHAVCRAARRPQRGRAGAGARRAHGRCRDQGTGRRARVGDSRAGRGGARDQEHPGRHPDPPQRLPAAQAAPGVRQQGGSSGTLTRAGVSALPPRGNEAVPQGRAVLQGEVRRRTALVRSRAARQAPEQAAALRDAAAREAEGAPRVRRARGAVPALLRRGLAPARA